jgi:hypothetical protein
MLVPVTTVLSSAFDDSPRFISGAIAANLVPGIVRALRRICVSLASGAGPASTRCPRPEPALKVLTELLESEEGEVSGVRETAINAGVIPVLVKLLRIPHESIVVRALGLAVPLMTAGPCGSSGGAARGAGELLRAIAGLISATPPLAAGKAADALFDILKVQPDLIVDYQSWGIDDTLRQLTTPCDLGTAASAKSLLSLVDKQVGVSSIPLTAGPWCCFLPFTFSCTVVCWASPTPHQLVLPAILPLCP